MGISLRKVATIVVEGLVVVLLSVLILATLNYFNILPISQNLRFLSFLPQQTRIQVTNKPSALLPNGTSGTIRTLVRPVTPLLISNDKNEYLYVPIQNSEIEVNGQIRIDAELMDNSTSDSSTSGIIFRNGIKPDDAGYQHLRVFYNPKDQNWLLEHKDNNKAQYYGISPKNDDPQFNFRRISLILSEDGKTITLLISGVPGKTITLLNSMFLPSNKMNMMAGVAPGSELNIYGLYYQY